MYPLLATYFCVLDALLDAVIAILLNSAVKGITTLYQPGPGLSSPRPLDWEKVPGNKVALIII